MLLIRSMAHMPRCPTLLCQVTAPERVCGHEYFVQQLPGRPHPCYMRCRLATDGSSSSGGGGQEVVLDVNELAAVHGEYVQVGQVRQHWECGGGPVDGRGTGAVWEYLPAV